MTLSMSYGSGVVGGWGGKPPILLQRNPALAPCGRRVLFLAWLPYTPGSLLEDGSFAAAAADVAQSMHSAKGAVADGASWGG